MTPEQAELKALGFEVPDSITPIVACRSWKMMEGILFSHNGTPWTPGKAMKAVCRVGGEGHHRHIIAFHGDRKDLCPEDIPLEVCSCGFYAAKHEKAHTIVPVSPHYVHGEIYMWGKIFEGPNGYRSEFAYPKRFFATSQWQKTQIEDMGFGVPVIIVEGGLYSRLFPFPMGKTQAVTQQATSLFSIPLLPGLPALAVGLVDGLTLDMSRGFNQALVAVMCAIGLAAAALSLYTYHLRKEIEKMRRRMGMVGITMHGGVRPTKSRRSKR